jgi:aspartate aminotransferase
MSNAAPFISKRSLDVPSSPIRKLVPLADRAKKRGIKVYHLNIGQPDIPTPAEFFQAVARFPEKVLEYGNSKGNQVLLEKISQYYAQYGLLVRPEEIQVTTGGSEAILFAFFVVSEPGDEIIVFEPFYTNYNSFAVQTGTKLVPVATSAADGYRLPELKTIESKITSRTRAIFICNPNNPTGTVLTRLEIESLAWLCHKHNLFLIADEVYREFTYSGEHYSILNLKELQERVIVVDSFSKRYSLCGARLGCLTSKNKDVMSACLRLGQARLCSPTLDQFGLIHTLSLGKDYFNTVAEEYRERRDLVFAELNQIRGVLCQKPEGAFYVMAKFPVQDIEDFSAWLLTDFSFENQTTMIAPGPGFYATLGAGKQEARIAYVLNLEELKKAMRALAEGVRAYQDLKVKV